MCAMRNSLHLHCSHFGLRSCAAQKTSPSTVHKRADPSMISSLISEILFGFTGLISIINPIAIAFVFVDRTDSLTDAERAALAKRVSINAFFVLLVVFFVGTP